MDTLNDKYWQQRYLENRTGWDIGYPSPALINYFKKLPNKDSKILIPGAGNAHEAVYLWENGFKNVFICDWAPTPLDNVKKRVPDFPENQLLCMDFFALKDSYDVVMEQTFFCALDPSLREKYIEKMHALLRTKGVLFGLLFDFPDKEDGPPFGGTKKELMGHLEKCFSLKVFEKCTNSIEPRKDKEWFFVAQKS